MSDAITLELLHPDARAPERATEDSAGYDLFVHLTHRTVVCSGSDGTWELPTFRDREKNLSYFELPPNATAMIPLGFKARLPSGCEAQIRPRSGLAARSGVTVLNSPGTVDADYRGEVKVVLANLGAEDFTVTRGMRIAQIEVSLGHEHRQVDRIARADLDDVHVSAMRSGRQRGGNAPGG